MPGRSSAPARLPCSWTPPTMSGCRRAPGRTAQRAGPGRSAERPAADDVGVGAERRRVERDQAGGLAGVDHDAGLGPGGTRAAATSGGEVLERPDVGLAVDDGDDGGLVADRGAPARRGRRARGRPPGTVSSPPASRVAVRHAASVAGCSTAVAVTRRPRARLPASRPAHGQVARLGGARGEDRSTPGRGRPARPPGPRARSRASAGRRPHACRLDGLPNSSCQEGQHRRAHPGIERRRGGVVEVGGGPLTAPRPAGGPAARAGRPRGSRSGRPPRRRGCGGTGSCGPRGRRAPTTRGRRGRAAGRPSPG